MNKLYILSLLITVNTYTQQPQVEVQPKIPLLQNLPNPNFVNSDKIPSIKDKHPNNQTKSLFFLFGSIATGTIGQKILKKGSNSQQFIGNSLMGISMFQLGYSYTLFKNRCRNKKNNKPYPRENLNKF